VRVEEGEVSVRREVEVEGIGREKGRESVGIRYWNE
jgi:hypothetical protein